MEICERCKKPITESKWEKVSSTEEDGLDSYFHNECWDKSLEEME